MTFIIGIDDTDNLESRGTGYLARSLGDFLLKKQVFQTQIILRHQLYVHKDIPFTSHNSSASLKGALLKKLPLLIELCESFLTTNAAFGSDVGLCIYTPEAKQIDDLIQWGLKAKSVILTETEAYRTSETSLVYLKGLTGRKTGVIGALAAVGLALSGNDGRVLWMESLRETKGLFKVQTIKEKIGIDIFSTEDGLVLSNNDLIELGNWNRPIVKNNQTILYVEPIKDKNNEYKTASKHFIKSLSE